MLWKRYRDLKISIPLPLNGADELVNPRSGRLGEILLTQPPTTSRLIRIANSGVETNSAFHDLALDIFENNELFRNERVTKSERLCLFILLISRSSKWYKFYFSCLFCNSLSMFLISSIASSFCVCVC